MSFNPEDYLSSLYAETAPPSPLDNPEVNARISDAYDTNKVSWYRNIKTQTVIIGACAIPVGVLAFGTLNTVVRQQPADIIQSEALDQDEDTVAEQLDKERTANALFDLERALTSEEDTVSKPVSVAQATEPAKKEAASRKEEPVAAVPVNRRTVPSTMTSPPQVRRPVQSPVTRQLPLIPPERTVRPIFTPPGAADSRVAAHRPAQVVTYRASPRETHSTATPSLVMANEGYQQANDPSPTEIMARVQLPDITFTDNSTKAITATLTEDFDTGATLMPAGSQLTLSARVDTTGRVDVTVLSVISPAGHTVDTGSVDGLRVMANRQYPLTAQKTITFGNEIADDLSQSVQRGISEAFNEANVLEGLAPDIPIIGEILENTVETTLSQAETRAKALAAIDPVDTWQLPATTVAYLVGDIQPTPVIPAPSVANQQAPLPIAPAPVTQETEPIPFGQPLFAPAAPPEPVPAPVISADSPRFVAHTTGRDVHSAPQPMTPAIMPVLSLPVTPGVGRSLVTVNGDRIVTAFTSQSQQVAIDFDAPLCADGASGCSTASAQVMHLLVSETAALPINITVITEGQAGRHLHTVMLEPGVDALEMTPILLQTPNHETSHAVI